MNFTPQRCVAGKSSLRICILAAAVAVLFTAFEAFADENSYETPGEARAREILEPDMLKGKYHTVDEQVDHDGLYYQYTVHSEFGEYRVLSTNALAILIHELQAIAAMKQVEADDAAIEAIKESGKNTVSGLKNLFSDPKGTAEGAAAGVGSLFNRAKETVGKRKITDAEDSRFEQLVGIAKAKGEIATKYGVNVYSNNEALQVELDRLGQADFFGGLGVGVATSFVPGVGGLALSASGAARLLNEAINTTPASELWLQNKNKLLAMGADSDSVELFLNNPVFSPALATVLVSALDSMKEVANRELFVKVGLQASDITMARTITEMTVMAAGYHANISTIKQFKPMARFAMGVKPDGSMVVLLPVDNLIWSPNIASAAEQIIENEESSKAHKHEIWIMGKFSDRARAALTVMGWKLHEQTKKELMAMEE